MCCVRLAESIGLSHRSTLLTSSPTNVKKPGDDENKLRWWTSNRMLTMIVFRRWESSWLIGPHTCGSRGPIVQKASYNVNVVMLMMIMSRWSVQEITEAVCLLEVRAQLSPFLTTTTLMLNFRWMDSRLKAFLRELQANSSTFPFQPWHVICSCHVSARFFRFSLFSLIIECRLMLIESDTREWQWH